MHLPSFLQHSFLLWPGRPQKLQEPSRAGRTRLFGLLKLVFGRGAVYGLGLGDFPFPIDLGTKGRYPLL